MKCRSVACVWSATPPSLHCVTATTVINHPPTLYTGGADGSIFWWNLSTSSQSQPEIKPVALLCGHIAPIADLGVCHPSAVSGDGKTDHSSNSTVHSSSSDNYGALISACADGVLCVWSRGSGHCRRRRKLAPWVGSPSVLRTLPSNPRYVCVGCSFVDCNYLGEHQSLDYAEGPESPHHRKPPKCSVVIVDSYTLVIIRTVLHCNVSTGPPRFMAVSSSEDREKNSAILIDSYGRLQCIPISKDSSPDRVEGNDMHENNSQLKMVFQGDSFGEGAPVLSCAHRGDIIAFLFHDRCLFRQLDNGDMIGEICVNNNFDDQSHVAGCLFLETDRSVNVPNLWESNRMFKENFIIWSDTGSAIVYCISFSNDIFKCKYLYSISSTSCPGSIRCSFSFCQLGHHLLRIESIGFDVEETFQWKPFVTAWVLKSCQDDSENLCLQFVMESSSSVEGVSNSNLFCENSEYGVEESNIGFLEKYVNKEHTGNTNYSAACPSHIVSSSMVIAETSFTPYAVVYGYYSGEIEIIQFDVVHLPNPQEGSSCNGMVPNVSKQKLLGHTGAVLSLAAHHMVGAAKGCNFCQVLISGSKDCTVRVWDLDNGNLIIIMHQHVAPVRQIILPPFGTERPWSDCFLSVGDDSCVALVSLETLRVERMFPGHINYPERVVWDGTRGYIACLCQSSGFADTHTILYIWDVRSGARERILRGAASHSMFDHFCQGIGVKSVFGSVWHGNTSTSSLLVPIIEDEKYMRFHKKNSDKGVGLVNTMSSTASSHQSSTRKDTPAEFQTKLLVGQSITHSIKCSCPFPGVAALSFDLASLMLPFHADESAKGCTNQQINSHPTETSSNGVLADSSGHDTSSNIAQSDCNTAIEECILRFSLSFLHSWNVDHELDRLLINDMNLKRPENSIVTSGLQGDKGSFTLIFPGIDAVLELWKSSSEFCAMRSMTMVSLAQRMISLSHSTSAASSALAAFYTRNFAERFPDIKAPSLQLLVSFWQDDSEHVRMAARSLFHCAASRAIPGPLCSQKVTTHLKYINSVAGNHENEIEGLNEKDRTDNSEQPQEEGISQVEESNILAWLESYEVQDWISCVGGTGQDAMTSHIIVAAALAIWYPSLVKSSLASLVVHHLVKLVMATNEKYSCTAAELLAEGMEETWKACIASEIPHLIGDIFFQVECVSSSPASPAVPNAIRETLIGVLLPSLAMADIPGFLNVIESQIWSTASDSPVHVVSLTTLIRVVRGAPKNLAQYLDKVISFILQTMDPGNSVMRRTCLQSSMATLKEVIRVFPMVALNDAATRLAVGDAVGEFSNASIRIYDVQSGSKIKVLDASAPPGLPSLLAGSSGLVVTTVISALSFSPNGEGLVAFSEHGLMIRWWSLGSAWWEKLSRNHIPVQCTKLIFVPPWEEFSPKTARTSVIASIMGHDGQASPQEKSKGGGNDADSLKLLIHNLDLSYRLDWAGDKKVLLKRHGRELGTFLL